MCARSRDKEEGSRVLVACGIMKRELELLRRKEKGLEIRYLEQGLHRTPEKMAPRIQEQIDQVAEYADSIVLGYGLCSNGIVGVTARRQGLVVPRCHDCIALFFGSLDAYREAFSLRPGTYYLTPGWIAERKDPLGIIEEDYTPRVGRETALWAMEEELRHYTHITFINTGIGDIEPVRERARENARFLKKIYDEVQGSREYLAKLIRGPYATEDFIFFRPGESVTQKVFLND